MAAVLDIAALRSLAAIADEGGFHRAAEVLHLSQSAVSQHVRRLERIVGRPLVERAGRATRFTASGEVLLAEARRILAAHDDALDRLQVAEDRPAVVVGTTEHAADRILPAVAAALHAGHPEYLVKVRLDKSGRLNDGIDRGTIDVAIFLGDPGEREVRSAGELPLSWFAAPRWAPPRGGQPMPLVVIDDPCVIRRKALKALKDSGIPASVVGEAAYLAGVVNAARAGVGVALLANVGAPPEGLEPRPDLPAVEPEPLHLRRRPGMGSALADTALSAVRSLLAVPALR